MDANEQNNRMREFLEAKQRGADMGLVKISVRVDFGPVGTEHIWAEPCGQLGVFRLKNIPFFADLGLGDVVRANLDENGQLLFNDVVEKVSHTIRVIYDVSALDQAGLRARIKAIAEASGNLRIESAAPGFLVLCVPVELAPDSDTAFWDKMEDDLSLPFVTEVLLPAGF